MLTIRSSFILATTVSMLFIGLASSNEPLALIALSFLLWILIEWICFQRILFAYRRTLDRCSRSIDGQSEETTTMVTDRTYKVQVRGLLPARTRGYRLTVFDTVPDTFTVVSGKPFAVIDSVGLEQFQLDYEVQSPICGKMAFPGLRVEINDHWGFFRTEQFVSLPQKPTVLPFLIRPQTTCLLYTSPSPRDRG